MKKFLLGFSLLFASHIVFGTNCSGTYSIVDGVTITVDKNNRNHPFCNAGAGSPLQVLFTQTVKVESGGVLIIKGTDVEQLDILLRPGNGFIIEKGGLIIAEYADFRPNGACPGTDPAVFTNISWDGFLVKGNPNVEQYDFYGTTTGWDPYAEPFVPWGQYRTNAQGKAVHGRLQMRWCKLQDLWVENEPKKAQQDDISTDFINETQYGSYGIRSTKGGILDIVACEFTKVYRAILIDNYTKIPAATHPGSRLMNAFNIIDCDFTVYRLQRSSNKEYRFCIELYEAQKVSVEGCHFYSVESDQGNDQRGTAIRLKNSSLLMHKSGNFRRNIDVRTSGETGLNCLLYGNEQASLSGYAANHPWKTNTPRKCLFSTFYRAIETLGGNSKNPLHTLVVDDAEFEHCFYGVKLQGMMNSTLSRNSFLFETANQGFTQVFPGKEKHFNGSANSAYNNVLGSEDRMDITVNQSRNTILSQNTFTSDYAGVPLWPGRTVYVALANQEAGRYNDNTSEYIYDLVYKNTFNPSNHLKDIGCWVAEDGNGNLFGLFNCNTLQNLEHGIFIGSKSTKLQNQFHYTDMATGRNAAAKNTFSNNTCNFGYVAGYTGTAINYYYENGGSAPSDCGNHLNGIQAGSGESNHCKDMSCTVFPMIDNSINKQPAKLEIAIYPNPSQNGQVNFQYEVEEEGASLSIYDSRGRKISQKTLIEPKGIVSLQINAHSGVYLALIESNSEVKKQLFIISE